MNNIRKQMTPAMIGYLTGLIYRNTRTSCLCLASLSELAHDQLYRLLYAAFPYSRRLWEWLAVRLVGEKGYLISDDTTWQRWTKKRKQYRWCGIQQSGKLCWGECCVVVWIDGRRKVPLGIRVWQKDGLSKGELAGQLLRQIHSRGISAEFVLFDSWYSAASVRLISSKQIQKT